jgi:hypothetical protein
LNQPPLARRDGWIRHALSLLVLLGSLSAMAEAPPFEVEPTSRATVGTTEALPEGTTLRFSAQDFKENEMLLLQRCGNPCNTAKLIRTWRKPDFDGAAQKSVLLAEAGTYYFWILRTLANGEVGPVLSEGSTFEGAKGRVRFASGTNVSVELLLPSSK